MYVNGLKTSPWVLVHVSGTFAFNSYYGLSTMDYGLDMLGPELANVRHDAFSDRLGDGLAIRGTP